MCFLKNSSHPSTAFRAATVWERRARDTVPMLGQRRWVGPHRPHRSPDRLVQTRTSPNNPTLCPPATRLVVTKIGSKFNQRNIYGPFCGGCHTRPSCGFSPEQSDVTSPPPYRRRLQDRLVATLGNKTRYGRDARPALDNISPNLI
jgi:hypothetical protein